jgi:hypothetical protein
MSCRSCQSARQVEFAAEIAIHFSGAENLNAPHVHVFPEILVCMDCGMTNFTVAGSELQTIRERETGVTST